MSLISTSTATSVYSWPTFIISSSPKPSSILSLPSSSSYLPQHQLYHPRSCFAIKTGNSESYGYGPDLLRKPLVSPTSPHTDTYVGEQEQEQEQQQQQQQQQEQQQEQQQQQQEQEQEQQQQQQQQEQERFVDWEDQILEDTVPLVGFVRMILHTGKYQSGDRLSDEHQRTILDRLLPYHPDYDNKIGCGVDYITIGYHPQFQDSRCLFIVRKDGELVDFSYWKCIKGFIRQNYPLYADSFILKHFRRRRRYE